MQNKSVSLMVLTFSLVLTLLWSVNAYAFTSAGIFEAIVSSHDDNKTITDVREVEGTNNSWRMKFLTETAETEDEESHDYGIPTVLRYSGSRLYISQKLAKVDYRVVEDVFKDSDVADKLEAFENYDAMMSDMKGFKAKVTHDGLRMNLEGSVSVAGKSMDEVKSMLVELREETADLYHEIDVANQEALADYFENVLDKDYGAIVDVQTFIEVLGHGFTKTNQKKRKESRLGHWAWKVGDVAVETINFGRYFDEVFLLTTGENISQYKQEKMVDELQKRIKTRLPKGASKVSIRPHNLLQGQTVVVLEYNLEKNPDGYHIREYHEKFIKYVESIYPEMLKIVNKYTSAAVSQKVKLLSKYEFMELMDDGLEDLPLYEESGADGQWKFKYKNVAYIVTNHKKYMSLSFIKTLSKGRNINDIIRATEAYIDLNFPSFAESYEVKTYKTSKRTILVSMRFNYGVLSASEITGQKLKEQYHQFINDIAPELQSHM